MVKVKRAMEGRKTRLIGPNCPAWLLLVKERIPTGLPHRIAPGYITKKEK